MPRRRTLIWLTLSALIAIAVAYTAWLAWQVNGDLGAAVDDAGELQSTVSSGDAAGADEALARLRDHSSSAAKRTDTIAWSVLTRLPVIGDDAAGVRLVSRVISDLSRDGIEPLVRTSQDLEGLLPRNGRISVAAVESLQQPVAEGLAAFEAADARLSAEDPTGFVETLKSNYRDLSGRVDDAVGTLASAATALEVMPGMLGAQGPRNYLFVFQNNAEIRATGGLPGAVSLVHARDGKVRMTRQIAGNTFGERESPVLPLTPAELEIYDEQLGTYFLDANFTPDFPRTADLMKARWEETYPERLDGVLSLDPVALSYILKATGPVTIGDSTLTSENAVDELLHRVYLRYGNPADQDKWFRLVARAVFDTVSSGAESPEALIEALSRAVDERRLYVHSFAEPEQAALAGSAVAGELVTDPEAAPQVGVYLNDATGAKMSYFLRHSVQVDATSCGPDGQRLLGRMHLLSVAPEDAASLPGYVTGAEYFGTKPGSQLVLVRLYGPVEGDIIEVELNGELLKAPATVQDGRPVVTAVVFLKPQFTVDLTWRMKAGPGQTEDTHVEVTPGVLPRGFSSLVPTACGW